MADPYVFPDPPWPAVTGVLYGHDLSCRMRDVSLEMPDGTFYTATIVDFDAQCSEVDGRLGLLEALERRLLTYAGTLIDDPNYGRDLRDYLNDDIDTRTLALIASGAVTELEKDERVVQCKATAALVDGVLTVAIRVFDSQGPFRLTLLIDQVGVAVLTDVV